MKQGGVHQRRRRFIKEYLIDQNATRAAKAAGYSQKGAEVAGNRLLRNDRVRAAIEEGNAQVNAKLDVTVERVKLELARLAFFDPRKFLNADGSAKLVTELDDDTAMALAGFETAELFTGSGEKRELAGYVKKFKLADRGQNLERLGRHLQMFPTKVEVSGEIGVRKLDDGDLQGQIDDIMQRLGLEGQVNTATAVGIAQAGAVPTNGHAQDTELVPVNGAVKA